MSENMTDKQMEVILNLVADKFSNCKNMEEVAKAVQEVRDMAKKEKPNEQALGVQKGRWTGEFNQIAYQNEFNKRNYDRIEIKVPKGRKAVIKAAATAAGQSVNEFISQAIDERMGSGGQQSHRERIRI